MKFDSILIRVLYIVDRITRTEFPIDFDRRCIYSAYGVLSLLRDAGVSANIVGGDFLAFVVAKNGQKAGMQGFGSKIGELSHFWVDAGGSIIDLGPRYLPKGSSFPAAPMPIAAWQVGQQLPTYLRYKPLRTYREGMEVLSDGAHKARRDLFVRLCRERYNAQRGQPKLPTWLLTDDRSVKNASDERDLWAINARKFQQRVPLNTLAF